MEKTEMKTQRQFKNIAKLVKESRIALEPYTSQEALSSFLGLKNGQYISNIERGLCSVPDKFIRIYAASLSIPPLTLVTAKLEDYNEFLLSIIEAGER